MSVTSVQIKASKSNKALYLFSQCLIMVITFSFQFIRPWSLMRRTVLTRLRWSGRKTGMTHPGARKVPGSNIATIPIRRLFSSASWRMTVLIIIFVYSQGDAHPSQTGTTCQGRSSSRLCRDRSCSSCCQAGTTSELWNKAYWSLKYVASELSGFFEEKKNTLVFSYWLCTRSSRNLLKGSTPRSSVLPLPWPLLPPFRLSQPHPHHLQSLQQTKAQTGEWITSLLVCWTMNTQQGQEPLALGALEAAEHWPLAFSLLHGDLHFLRRTAALTLLHPLPV